MLTDLKPASEMKEPIRVLLKQALAVQKKAYAPFSKFRVGCALRDGAGKIHAGCNVENASYGATICAERSAIVQMIASGNREIREIVIVTTANEAFFPCGLCLQVIMEFGSEATVVAVDKSGKKFRTAKMSELYPSAFSSETWKHE